MRVLYAISVFAWAMAVASSSLALSEEYLPADIPDGGSQPYVDNWSDSSSAIDFDCDGRCLHDCDRMFGMLPSDHCFDRFVSPISNPFYFEDPRSLTEVRGIFLDNSLPESVGGGDAQVWAAQVRGRLSERWSIIAPRVGYLQVNQSGEGAPVGFMSTPLGFKYNFLQDAGQQQLISAGATYFIPGSSSAFSNFGDGDFHFFLTGGQEIIERGHWLSATGYRVPIDGDSGTQLWYWSNQWDYEVVDHWYGLFGVNWFQTVRSATNGIGAIVTALDLIDIPASGVTGNDFTTAVAGIAWKPSSHFELASGFEFPLTDRTDILHNRAYAEITFRY